MTEAITEEKKPTTERLVTHRFTEDEITAFRKDISDKTLLLDEKETVKKAVTSTVSMLQAQLSELVIKVRNGKEERKMQCPVIFHWDTGKKDIIHPETGAIEITTDISDEDRQQNLPMEAFPPEDSGKQAEERQDIEPTGKKKGKK